MPAKLLDISEILIEITGGEKPIMCLKEVAHIMGCDYNTAWGYRAGQTEPKWRDVVRLSHHLIKDHGYWTLGMQPTLISVSGRSDGRVSDDLLKIMENSTDLNRAFESDDRTQYWKAYQQLQEELKDLKSEGIKKFGGQL